MKSGRNYPRLAMSWLLALRITTDGASKHVLVVIDNPGGLNTTESARLKRWLAVRMPDSEIDLVTGKIQR